jgi:hypothetical protein
MLLSEKHEELFLAHIFIIGDRSINTPF